MHSSLPSFFLFVSPQAPGRVDPSVRGEYGGLDEHQPQQHRHSRAGGGGALRSDARPRLPSRPVRKRLASLFPPIPRPPYPHPFIHASLPSPTITATPSAACPRPTRSTRPWNRWGTTSPSSSSAGTTRSASKLRSASPPRLWEFCRRGPRGRKRSGPSSSCPSSRTPSFGASVRGGPFCVLGSHDGFLPSVDSHSTHPSYHRPTPHIQGPPRLATRRGAARPARDAVDPRGRGAGRAPAHPDVRVLQPRQLAAGRPRGAGACYDICE